MNQENIKNKIFHFQEKQRGVALLFSVMLSSVLLTIVLGVLSIVLKELSFSTSAKDTNKAFFAADSALECALFYNDGTVFIDGGIAQISCVEGSNIPVVSVSTTEPYLKKYQFSVVGLSSDTNAACANVLVVVDESPVGGGIEITSKGYNADQSGSCDQSGRSNSERVLQATILNL